MRNIPKLLPGLSPALLVGMFCAASNVTGVLNDDLLLTALLHAHGALVVWDYATAAPHAAVDVNPRSSSSSLDPALLAKDAVFFSAHKFVGGVQAPGVLVAKKRLFQNPVPDGGEREKLGCLDPWNCLERSTLTTNNDPLRWWRKRVLRQPSRPQVPEGRGDEGRGGHAPHRRDGEVKTTLYFKYTYRTLVHHIPTVEL